MYAGLVQYTRKQRVFIVTTYPELHSHITPLYTIGGVSSIAEHFHSSTPVQLKQKKEIMQRNKKKTKIPRESAKLVIHTCTLYTHT